MLFFDLAIGAGRWPGGGEYSLPILDLSHLGRRSRSPRSHQRSHSMLYLTPPHLLQCPPRLLKIQANPLDADDRTLRLRGALKRNPRLSSLSCRSDLLATHLGVSWTRRSRIQVQN